ncbi:MAG: hypothetical protein U0S50_12405 [Sphingopyxis sp.]|uniref:hypothetical protein n=1 Tax=Sphingopyxis sp. TaxID=1908224 RepID=UPI002ABBBE91|nr:hypothetical protein [Sphingopyxis sp.]MDZ3832598.1 hypothetical protein [Sphingopyxis sp.]
MGWTSTVTAGGAPNDALERLRAALSRGPVWVGPVEMGWLRQQPGKNGPTGADHYIVVLEVAEDRICFHDPEGHPFATLPTADFMAAWRGEALDYGTPFTMRCDFRRVRPVPEEEMIRSALPAASRWLSMRHPVHLPPGTLGNAGAAERLADMIEAACGDDLRSHLVDFAVRAGARRLADAATCLFRIGYAEAARIASEQAALVGALQYPLVTGKDAEAAALLRRLAPTYRRLERALQTGETAPVTV